ncbi:MAG: hypothetical protein ACM31C_34160 [Acidobacteriota bacterium]
MRRILMVSTLALGLSGGAAFADHDRGGGYSHGGGYARGGGYSHGEGYARGGVSVRPTYRGGYGGYRGSYYRGGYYGGDYRGSWGYRRPIYMRAPVIREHYYNYYRQPSLIVEDYGPMDGYVWIRGHWAWSGYEWIWQPGYFQPVY